MFYGLTVLCRKLLSRRHG